MSSAERGDARILDVGFAGYDGARSGPVRSVLSLARWSLLRVFGRRRGWTAKALPLALAGLAFIPGVGVLAVRALLADRFDTSRLPVDILPYADYIATVGTVILVWTALIQPELVCPDRRSRTLGLYIATAVSARQYLAGKLLAALTAMLGLTLLPVLVLFAGNVFFATASGAYLKDHVDDLGRILIASLLVSVYWSLFGLAVASLTSRRAYAVGGFLGIVLLSGVAAGFVSTASSSGHAGTPLSLATVPIALGREVFKHDPEQDALWLAVSFSVVCLVSLGILLFRYRGRE